MNIQQVTESFKFAIKKLVCDRLHVVTWKDLQDRGISSEELKSVMDNLLENDAVNIYLEWGIGGVLRLIDEGHISEEEFRAWDFHNVKEFAAEAVHSILEEWGK